MILPIYSILLLFLHLMFYWDLKWYGHILLNLEIEYQSILSYHSRHGC